jgi:hypothetical protein
MPTALESWWLVQNDPALSSTQKDAALATLRADAYDAIDLPVGISGTDITITQITTDGALVECTGTGPFSWPLRLYYPPIGIPDSEGTETAPDGGTWRTDPIEVIADAVRSAL